MKRLVYLDALIGHNIMTVIKIAQNIINYIHLTLHRYASENLSFNETVLR